MKKILIIFLAAVIVILPFSFLYGEEASLFDRYIDNDTLLADYTEKYNSLVMDREERLEIYDNYRISYKNAYYAAIGTAAKENGILQVDWDIQNALYDMKAREALLEINFRNTLEMLYQKTAAADSSDIFVSEALSKYNETLSNHSKGYASDIELLEAEYNYKKAENGLLAAKRSLESSIRSFDSMVGYSLDEFDNYLPEFKEVASEPAELEFYIDSALENSKSLDLIRQDIARYETELRNLSEYYISESLTYYKDKKDSIETNLAILCLTLEQKEFEVQRNVESKYTALSVERERISLFELSLEIAETNHEINKDLFNRNLIDRMELDDSSKSVNEALAEYDLAVHGYNTMLLELEYDCACFMSEDER